MLGLIRRFLPLHILAKHARVAKVWTEAYKERLVDEQRTLRALMVAPEDASHVPTFLQRAVAGLEMVLPVFESPAWLSQGSTVIPVDGAWRRARSNSGPSVVIPFRVIHDYYGICIQDSSPRVRIFVNWHTPDHLTLRIRVHVCAITLEGLQCLIGLLLELAQGVLPRCCGGLQGPLLGAKFQVSVVVCRLPFKTGWNMWAPLAR